MPLYDRQQTFPGVASEGRCCWEGVGCSRDIAVDNLGEADVPALGEEVEGLRLDAGRVHGLPFQVVLRELREGRLLRLDGHGAEGGGAVDRLGRPGDIGDSARSAEIPGMPVWTYCCLSQFMLAYVKDE